MKKICIITTDVILGYQPTVLNLYDNLSKHFDVSIVSFAPRYISSTKVAGKNVIYLPENKTRQKLNEIIDFGLGMAGKYINHSWLKKRGNNYFQKKLFGHILERWLKTDNSDEYIAVDFMALYIFQQAKATMQCHLVSLEIFKKDPYRDRSDFSRIKSVIIQSRERYEHLFGNAEKKIFYIQNAPDSASFCFDIQKNNSLLWAGTIVLKFGVMYCVDFIDHDNNYQLTLKGGAQKKALQRIHKEYSHLLQSGKLIIDNNYLDSNAFISYLSKFRIGFCFYDIELAKTDFNYQTAPSGKLFSYYAAAVPVIALNIPGLRSVEDFNAGILIDDYSYESILGAIGKINSNYDFYFEGCKRAAIHFAFDKHCNAFIEFLKQT